MKNKLMVSGIVSIMLFGSIAYAIVVGFEPPATYINNLKNCTRSTLKQTTNGMVQEYTIKGLLPNGKCEVSMSYYTDFSDPKVYEAFKTRTKFFMGMAKNMAKDKNIPDIKDSDFLPSQQEMIEQGKKRKTITVCKFSKEERTALYNAYQKYDSKKISPAKVENGNVSFSYDTSKISYDNLMMKLNDGPCSTNDVEDISSEKKEKKYVCEYADTTCYWTDLGNGAASMSCTNEDRIKQYQHFNFELMDKVEQHVRAGMCQRI